MADSTPRSIVKALSWRVIATLITALLAYLVTGNLEIAAKIGALDVVIKLAAYFLHERLWNRISYGKRAEPDFDAPNYQI